MKALGLIETMGLVAAVEAADAMLKAAEVHLLEKTFVGSGLVTITIEGDVAAVQASVDAGVAAVQRIQESSLISRYVIPRPDSGLEGTIVSYPSSVQEKTAKTVNSAPEQGKQEMSTHAASPAVSEPTNQEEECKKKMQKIGKMTVSQLRSRAQGIETFPMGKTEINKAAKKELLDAFKQLYSK